MDAELKESVFARLINIAGRQRMLSQRIGFILSILQNGTGETGGDAANLAALLKTAIRDFTHGYTILLKGDADQELPPIASLRVSAVLDGKTAFSAASGAQPRSTQSGRAVIERFLHDANSFVTGLEGGAKRDARKMSEFSAFVLGPVLQTLQAIVEALEADFDEEMRLRRDKRSADVELVMAAAGEIQKASKFSRMIALNAKISASRAGAHGQEFGALTEEIKKISHNITESSQEIMRHLDHV